MHRELQEMPIEAAVVIPFLPLSEFTAHEQEFLAGIGIHPGVKHPQVGEFLPGVTWHFVDQRSFAVNDFVMAEHEDKMFLERIEQGEGDVALMIFPVNWLPAHVHEEVVHPAHVPFEPKS